MITKTAYGDLQTIELFDQPTGKYNTNILLDADDVDSKTRIYCSEPHAQEFFNTLKGSSAYTGIKSAKDMEIGEVIKVRAVSYNTQTKVVTCENVGNGISIMLPFNEFAYDVETIAPDFMFDIVITKANGNYCGTCKNAAVYMEELKLAAATDGDFEVKLVKLIRGGYLAIYKGTVECFLPGSHAAANIVNDFHALINKTLPVMIDNYDSASHMFVVSYKKYVAKTMPKKIHELKLNHKYVGRLTSNPTEFGLFIEIEGYYTGLAHRVDFKDQEAVYKKYKAGDEIEVYVKNIMEKRGNYRIVFTMNPEDTDKDKLAWYNFKIASEGTVRKYEYSQPENKLYIILGENEKIGISLSRSFDSSITEKWKEVKVHSVNILTQEIKFDFYMVN